VNVCLLDLSKAFDKINHSALFIKLMDRSIPVHLSVLGKLVCYVFIIVSNGVLLLRVSMS